MKRYTFLIILAAAALAVLLSMQMMMPVGDAARVGRGKPPTKTPSGPTATPGPSVVMHVQDVTMSWDVAPRNKYYGIAVVTIVDAGGVPVSGATVSGQWSGAASDSDAAPTGGDGQTDAMQSDTKRRGGAFTFCVNAVTKSGSSYDAGANVETCDTVTAPGGDPTNTPVPPTNTPEGPTPTPTATPEPGQAKWTVMVYLACDNNLEEYVVKDIETEYSQPGSNQDVNVVILADRAPGYDDSRGDWTQTLLYYVTEDMLADEASALEDWGERNMGDPQTLIDFVQWTKAHYPADNYTLMLSSHGWTWRPYQTIFDETDDDSLDMHEIVAAMDVLGPVDVIGYETCAGMCIENMALWRNYALSIVGSEDTMGLTSFEWEDFLPTLLANPTMSADTFASELADTQRTWTSSAATLGALTDDLIVAVDEWSVALLNGLPTYRADYDAAYADTQAMYDYPLNKDLYDAAEEIKQAVGDPSIQAKCQAVMDAVDAVILYEWHKGQGFYGDTNGIGIFWPKEAADLDEPSSPQWNDFAYYQGYLEFAAVTHWDEFLDAYVNGP